MSFPSRHEPRSKQAASPLVWLALVILLFFVTIVLLVASQRRTGDIERSLGAIGPVINPSVVASKPATPKPQPSSPPPANKLTGACYQPGSCTEYFDDPKAKQKCEELGGEKGESCWDPNEHCAAGHFLRASVRGAAITARRACKADLNTQAAKICGDRKVKNICGPRYKGSNRSLISLFTTTYCSVIVDCARPATSPRP